MEDDLIPFTYLNDFIFCPASIYFHQLMGGLDRTASQSRCQIEGTAAHERVDRGSAGGMLMGISVLSENLGIYGAIDMYDPRSRTLTERKNLVRQVYDGYVFQMYAQYYAMVESGYEINRMRLHSMKDNRNYEVPLPQDDPRMELKFKSLIAEIRAFRMEDAVAASPSKCAGCIYSPMCGLTGGSE